MFSDVAKGWPDNTCIDELEYIINRDAIPLIVFLMVNGGVGLIGFGISLAMLYFKPKKFNLEYFRSLANKSWS